MAVVENLPITIDQEKVAAFCRARGIRRLSLFGSVLRDDFDPKRSDVDVLVEFLPDQAPGWEFFVWHEELAEILGYKVDLFSGLNRWIEPMVHQEALSLYEQS
jgi:predicted nucleotidyltransferase